MLARSFLIVFLVGCVSVPAQAEAIHSWRGHGAWRFYRVAARCSATSADTRVSMSVGRSGDVEFELPLAAQAGTIASPVIVKGASGSGDRVSFHGQVEGAATYQAASDLYVIGREDPRRASLLESLRRLPDEDGTVHSVVTPLIGSERLLVSDANGIQLADLQPPDLASAIATLERCNSEALHTLGSERPAIRHATLMRGVTPIGPADYPAEALRQNASGVFTMSLEVASDGRVARCTVTRSTGSPGLDEDSCQLVSRRARYTPALDAAGESTGDIVTLSVNWQVPSQQSVARPSPPESADVLRARSVAALEAIITSVDRMLGRDLPDLVHQPVVAISVSGCQVFVRVTPRFAGDARMYLFDARNVQVRPQLSANAARGEVAVQIVGSVIGSDRRTYAGLRLNGRNGPGDRSGLVQQSLMMLQRSCAAG